MAKPIYMTNDDVEKILQEVKTQLLGMKCFGSVDIKRNFTKDERSAIVYFTQDAWNKVQALVREFDTEVQWHGCVNRISDDEFEIYNIVVPPHVVTGSTVTSDPVKYSEWINELDDDVFNFLHFHGHSHVNMGCSPSSTDMKYRQDIVTQLPTPHNENEDSFYIFLIFNKKGEWTGEIYDLKNNALYSTNEIDIEVYTDDGTFLSDFIADAKKMAVKETPKPAVTPTYTSSGYYGGGYYDKGKSARKAKTSCKEAFSSPMALATLMTMMTQRVRFMQGGIDYGFIKEF